MNEFTDEFIKNSSLEDFEKISFKAASESRVEKLPDEYLFEKDISDEENKKRIAESEMHFELFYNDVIVKIKSLGGKKRREKINICRSRINLVKNLAASEKTADKSLNVDDEKKLQDFSNEKIITLHKEFYAKKGIELTDADFVGSNFKEIFKKYPLNDNEKIELGDGMLRLMFEVMIVESNMKGKEIREKAQNK